MSLFGFELRKLLLNKKTLITLAVLFVVYAATGMVSIYKLGGKANYDIYSGLVNQQITTQDPNQAAIATAAYADAKKTYGDNADVIGDVTKVMPELNFNINYAKYIENQTYYTSGSPKDSYNVPYGINVFESQIAKLEQGGDTTSFAHDKMVDQLAIEQNLGEPVYANTTLWDKLFGLWGGSMLLILLCVPLAYIVSPVFSVETATGMDNIILSSKNGRRKIVTAKLASVLITSVVVACIYLVATFLVTFISAGSMVGWNAALRSVESYVRAPIGMAVWQYALVSAGWLVFVSAFIGTLVAFISSKINSLMGTFGATLCVIIGSLLLSSYAKNFPMFIQNILKFAPADLIQSNKLFSSYKVFNIFGNIVPYYAIAPIITAILTGILVWAIYHFQKTRTVA